MDQDGARSHRLEIVTTILLAVAAFGTAWSTFQAGRWRGAQASASAKSTAARVQSSEASTRAGQLTQIDIATFIQWVNAVTADEKKRASFYRERFRDEFGPAFGAWIATRPFTNPNAPTTPFAMPQYRPERTASSAARGRRGQPLDRPERRTSTPTTTC